MFYLKEFFKIARNQFVLFGLFLTTTFLILLLSINMTTIRKSLLSVNKGDSKPYFNAMIAKDMRVDGVVRKMKQLPGVDSIKLIQSSHVKKELEKIKSEFGSDVLDELSTLKSKNLKIFLENGISEKSFTLIKEYMERLVGGNAVTVSSIKKPRRAGMTLGFTKYLNHINFYTLAVLAGLWLFSLILMAKTIHTKAFIIEKFQRKSSVSQKIAFCGLAVIVLTTGGMNYLFVGDLDPYGAICMFVMAVITFTVVKFLPKKFIAL